MSSPQVSTIVRIPSGSAMEQWTILEKSEPFAQFHSKFWATSMAVEESEWRSTQTPVTDIESELKDSDRMDVDDEIDPGCYMLDIGIDGLPYPKIWIRAEYIHVFAYLQQYYDQERTHNLVPSVVITGQPGIGESFVASSPTYY